MKFILNILIFKEISEYEFTPDDKFFIIASDGVWEFLSNKQVLDIVEKYYEVNDADGAARKIEEIARKCWKRVFVFLFKKFC